MRHAWVAVLLVASCTNEVSIAQNTCGNYVLEPGEDCDDPSATCTTQCRISCDVTMRDTTCPSAMTCGTDSICHAPSGEFRADPLIRPFNAGSFVLSDLDGDLAADAMGITSGLVSVAHGGAQPFASVDKEPAPFASGPAGLGDYSGDGLPDVLVPTVAGVQAFETSSGTALPATFPIAIANPGTVHLRGALTSTGNVVTLDFQNGDGAMVPPGTLLSLDGANSVFPCGEQFGATLRGRSLHPYTDAARVRVPMLITGAVELSMPTKNVPPGVCIDTPGASSGSQRIATGLLGSTVNDGETFFVDLPGNVCPAIAIPLTVASFGEATLIAPGAGAPGSCTIAPPIVTGPGANTVVLPGLPLTSLRLATTPAATGIVTSKGVFTVDMTTRAHTQVSTATRNWRYAIANDLDGDGRQDLVAIANAEDVEVFTQLTSGTSTPQWRTQSIPTAATPALVDAGDLDGDGAKDVAFGVLDTNNDRTGTIAVAFAEPPGAFAPAQTFARLPEVDYLMVENVTDPSLPQGFDHTDDLVLAHGGDDLANGHAELTVLYGSGSRTLFAPWLAAAAGTQPYTYAIAAAAGHFAPGGQPGGLALFRDPSLTPGDAASTKFLPVVLAYDPTTGTFNATEGPTFTACSDSASFCALTAKLAVWSRSSGDVLLALRSDRPGNAAGASQCGGYFPDANGSFSALACTAMFEQGAFYNAHTDDLAAVSTLRMLDHTDTAATVAIATTNAQKQPFSLVFTVTMNSGVPVFGDGLDIGAELATAIGDPSVTCSDGAGIELGARTVDGVGYGAGRDLAFACTTAAGPGVFGRFAAPDPTQPPYYEKIIAAATTKVGVKGGDVDGDGLEDIVYLATQSSTTALFVHHQCDTHETTCSTKGGK